MREMISRAFSLSSAGTTYHGACSVLVALRQCFVGLHVFFPEAAFLEVVAAELPVAFRVFDAFEEATALFLLGQVQEEFDDARAVAVQMFFQVRDGSA